MTPEQRAALERGEEVTVYAPRTDRPYFSGMRL